MLGELPPRNTYFKQRAQLPHRPAWSVTAPLGGFHLLEPQAPHLLNGYNESSHFTFWRGRHEMPCVFQLTCTSLSFPLPPPWPMQLDIWVAEYTIDRLFCLSKEVCL